MLHPQTSPRSRSPWMPRMSSKSRARRATSSPTGQQANSHLCCPLKRPPLVVGIERAVSTAPSKCIPYRADEVHSPRDTIEAPNIHTKGQTPFTGRPTCGCRCTTYIPSITRLWHLFLFAYVAPFSSLRDRHHRRVTDVAWLGLGAP